MDISVVVVTLGETPVLKRCVGAVAGGSLPPRELVVVDQGAGNLRPELERWLSGSGIELRHIQVPRMGVSCARNTGAAAAKAENLAFTDDDCVPDREWLASLAAAIQSDSARAASGRVLPLEDPRPGLVAVSSRTDMRKQTFRASDDCAPWDVGTGGNLLIHRDAFDELSGFDEEFGPGARFRAAEDIDLLERLLRSGATLAYDPSAVVYHEMKTAGAVLKRSFPYGFGMGALISRTEGRRRWLLTRRYMWMHVWLAAAALAKGSPRRAMESILATAGFGVGFVAARLA